MAIKIESKIVPDSGSGVFQVHEVTKVYTDFATAGLTNDIEIFSLPPGGVIHAVKLKHSTAFTGGSIASYTLSVGVVGTLAKYLAAKDVFTAAGATVIYTGATIGADHQTNAISIRAEATGSHNLDTATAGSATFWIYYSVAT